MPSNLCHNQRAEGRPAGARWGGLLLIGLALGLVLPLLWPWPDGGLVAAVGVGLLLLRWQPPILWALLLGLVLSGMTGQQWSRQQLNTECLRSKAELVGVIDDFPTVSTTARGDTLQRFNLKVTKLKPERCSGPRRLRVSYWSAEPTVELGQTVAMNATLMPPSSQWNPGIIPDQAGNAARGTSARALAKSLSVVAAPTPMVSMIRRELSAAIDALPTTARTRAVLQALTVGQGSALHRDDWQRIQRLGLAHVLVISGLHIGLVFALVWPLARLTTNALPVQTGSVLPAAVLAMAAAAGYAMLAGFAVPTQRALLMLAGLMLARLLGWASRGRWALLLAVVVVLALDPFAVLGRSLWMSAGATAALMLIVKGINRLLLNGWWQRWLGLMGIQLALALMMAPLTLFWFDQVSVIGVVSNLLLVPPMALLVVPAALLGVVWHGLIDGQWNPLWWWASGVLEKLISAMDALDQSTLAFSVLALPLALASSAPGVSLTVLDVGQGLSVVWQEQEKVLVYDTGAAIPGGYSQTRKVLLPYLQYLGIANPQVLVVSHADTDHSGGIDELLADYTPRHHWGFRGVPCRPGEYVPWPGSARIRVLNGASSGVESDNASSCVLHIEYRGTRFLLAGDIPLATERALARYWGDALEAEVLVVGHHGSATSTGWTFLKWVQPDWAIISAGRANAFGHPAPSVTARLKQSGIKALNTADSGAIRFDIDADGELMPSARRDGLFPYWLALP